MSNVGKQKLKHTMYKPINWQVLNTKREEEKKTTQLKENPSKQNYRCYQTSLNNNSKCKLSQFFYLKEKDSDLMKSRLLTTSKPHLTGTDALRTRLNI